MKRVGVGAAATVVVAVSGGLVWRSIDQAVFAPGTGPAYEPWAADLDGPPPMSLVVAATLASSAHNTQPWAFAVSDDRIDVFADRGRTMGTMDALARELQLSLGCAIENLALAAQAHDLTPIIDLQPDPAVADHVAAVDLRPAASTISPLYRAIPERHTNRGAYDVRRVVPMNTLTEISDLADAPKVSLGWLTTREQRERFGRLTVDATAAILGDVDQARDDFAWYRQNWHDIERQRDGITIDAAGLGEPMRTLVRVLPASSQEQMQSGWLEATRDRHVATASAYGLVLVRDRADPVQLLEAGRLYQRAHLHATTRGLAMQPLNQALERADRETTIKGPAEFGAHLAEITPVAWDAVTAFRIGYPTEAAGISPRRPLNAVLW